MTIRPPTDTTATAPAAVGVDNNSNVKPQDGNHQPQQKYHALVVDSGAIIKQSSLTSSSNSNSLLHAATSYYTVPSVLSEIRDPKSRHHLSQFQFHLSALHNTTLQTRLPSKEAIRTVSEFARKTGDYSQLSSVDLQILALLYDLEMEAANLYHGGSMDHVRKEPKRVLGVCVQALNGGGGGTNNNRKNTQRSNTGDDADSMTMTQDGTNDGSGGGSEVNSISTTSVADGNGMIDAGLVDIEYVDDDDDEYEDEVGGDNDDSTNGASALPSEHPEKSMSGTTSSTTCSAPPPCQPKSWAQLVNPEKAAATSTTTTTTPPMLVNYSTIPTFQPEKPTSTEDYTITNTTLASSTNDVVAEGQFDDASSTDDDSEGSDDDDDESNAIQIANAPSDDEFSDEECDVFILEPHEAVYFKKLKENMKKKEAEGMSLKEKAIMHGREDHDDDGGLESEFPSLEAAAAVPYEGSDDEDDDDDDEAGVKTDAPHTDSNALSWQQEEEERKKKALQPMINGRLVKNEKKEMYNSFRKHGRLFSASGAAAAITKHTKEEQSKETLSDNLHVNIIVQGSGDSKETGADQNAIGTGNQEYKSRILGAAANVLAGSSNEADFTSEMTAEDDDGEGWVTCTRDIHSMKAKGSLSLTNSSSRHGVTKSSNPGKDVGPPTCQRAACATTDFAMQNVILQMNLELLSVDGVRVRRLKTWVTRCGACYTIYGSNDSKSKGGGRLFCDKCGSNTLHRIAASVDRNTGRLKLHMKKNYQYNTRGTKFSLPKPGKVSRRLFSLPTL